MKHDVKTLIILSPGFPKDEADTACLPSQQIFVKSLNKIFPSLKIIALSFRYPFSISPYKWQGNLIIPFNAKQKALLARIRIWRALDELKKNHHIVGLFSFWCGECALIGKYFGKRNNLKHFTWISGQDARKGNKYISLIRPKPYELVAMSDFLAKEFYKNYGVKPLHVVPIGIDASMFEKKIHKKNIDIIGVGSLISLKQYDIFISIIKSLSNNFDSIKTIICGKGPQKEALQSAIDKMLLSKNVLLIGEKPHTEVLQLMQRSKILLHTSSYEGFGAVCIEALYAGCHVISFVNPMKRDIDHWHVVKTKEEMINKVIELLGNSETEYTAELPYIMDDSVKAVMQLFNYKETITV